MPDNLEVISREERIADDLEAIPLKGQKFQRVECLLEGFSEESLNTFCLVTTIPVTNHLETILLK